MYSFLCDRFNQNVQAIEFHGETKIRRHQQVDTLDHCTLRVRTWIPGYLYDSEYDSE